MRKRLLLVSLAVILGLVLMELGISPALAAPWFPGLVRNVEPAEISFTGRVLSIYGQTRTLVVEANGPGSRSTRYTVRVPDGLDLNGLSAGDTVQVTGTLGEDGLIIARKVVKQGDASQPTPKPTKTKVPRKPPAGGRGAGNIFCGNEALAHPVAAAIAEAYGLDEDQILEWLCEGKAGIGQIVLALQTALAKIEAEDLDEDELYDLAGDLLSRRAEGEGWGQIWLSLGRLKPAVKARPGLGVSRWVGRLEKAWKAAGLDKFKDKDKDRDKPGKGKGRKGD